jgi:hypothetical protein
MTGLVPLASSSYFCRSIPAHNLKPFSPTRLLAKFRQISLLYHGKTGETKNFVADI